MGDGTTRISVPGKLILMGEHAAVYGRPAVVVAFGRRLRVDLRRGDEAGVELVLAEVGVREVVRWNELDRYTDSMRRRWERYASDPTPARFATLLDDDPARVVKLALGEARAAGTGVAAHTSSLRLEVRSEIPVGAGFGSSAAIAVAVIAAYRAHQGDPAWEGLGRAALAVERRQHGFPSGVDSATVFHGGVLWTRTEPDTGLSAEPLPARPDRLAEISVFDTGAPAESTGSVVAAVKALRDGDPDAFDELLDRMSEETERFRRALVAADSSAEDMIGPVRGFESCLERIGVVPDAVCERIRHIEAAGGAAKISGAGATRGAKAGSLLVLHPEPERIAHLVADLPCHDVGLGVEGLRVETAA